MNSRNAKYHSERTIVNMTFDQPNPELALAAAEKALSSGAAIAVHERERERRFAEQ